MNRDDGLRIARQVKKVLHERGYPIRRVILFGSVANNQAHDGSDIDIAVVTNPFKQSQLEEGVDIHLASMDVDLRIETVTLHPEDFQRPFCTLAREIERTGADV